MSWRLMKNPIALIVGGVAAVILELAEPRVRTGVWERTAFRTDPVGRIRRTGFATMATVYAPADEARAIAARVNQAHARISGETPTGDPYRADDHDLLVWVHATATYGFAEAYHRYVRKLSGAERDQYYAEAAIAGALFGAAGAPTNAEATDALFARMAPRLERSEIIFEFLSIMRRAPVLPPELRWMHAPLLRAAVDLTPNWAREILALDKRFGLRTGDASLLRVAGAMAERVPLRTAAPSQACVRMGLDANFVSVSIPS